MKRPWWAAALAFPLWFALIAAALGAEPIAPEAKVADIGGGIRLHYIEQGSGPAVIFIHGSLSDYTYWQDQVGAFAAHYRAIAYSRRYNSPNANPPQTGYSAVTDSDDLVSLIHALHLGKVYVIGHSYGALAALFAVARHPELFRAVVLAEPPAMSLLEHLHGVRASEGLRLFQDVQRHMVEPMKKAFDKGREEDGVAAFIDYVFDDPLAWQNMSASNRVATLRDAHEWDVMMTSGTLFPEISPETVRAISVPVLLMSGGKSFRFLALTDEELEFLIPKCQRIIFGDSGHQMWLQHPDEARGYAEVFFANHLSER
ncbi:MAG TPA: alpha/beta hydrolase [Rhizomicrobium sp.]|jgi:pimeloyl-ACP methyl ester carboxylesterase|nr:alpha/beta hydrolase [Rhizomicrobium sp.]